MGLSLNYLNFFLVPIDVDVSLCNLNFLSLENHTNYTIVEVLNGDWCLDQAPSQQVCARAGSTALPIKTISQGPYTK